MTAAERVRRALASLQDTEAELRALLLELERPAPPAPAQPPRRPGLHVCVDPGHGGTDSGAVAADGSTEKALVLIYGEELQATLTRRGHRVTMTRTVDAFVPLANRARKADEVGADVLVSLHANAADSKLSNGAWVIYDDTTKAGPGGGQALALELFKAMAEASPGVVDVDAAVEVFADRTPWVGGRNLAVLSTQRAVAVLVELGFMTNEDDLRALKVADTRLAICNAIVDGLEAWAAAR